MISETLRQPDFFLRSPLSILFYFLFWLLLQGQYERNLKYGKQKQPPLYGRFVSSLAAQFVHIWFTFSPPPEAAGPERRCAFEPSPVCPHIPAALTSHP